MEYFAVFGLDSCDPNRGSIQAFLIMCSIIIWILGYYLAKKIGTSNLSRKTKTISGISLVVFVFVGSTTLLATSIFAFNCVQ